MSHAPLRSQLKRTNVSPRTMRRAVLLGSLIISSASAAVDPAQLRHAQEKLWSWQNAEATAEFVAKKS
jgi:hypothetical protein